MRGVIRKYCAAAALIMICVLSSGGLAAADTGEKAVETHFADEI